MAESFDFEVIADDLAFPEGPVACADGSVLVGEILGRCVTRVHPDGHKELVAEIDGGPNGLAVGPGGDIFVCNNGGFGARRVDGKIVPIEGHVSHPPGSIQKIDARTGKVETVYVECDGRPLASPNDIMFAPDGSFWFTDLGKESDGVLKLGGLYHAQADGSAIRCVAHGIGLNGVGLSPDGATVYAAATYQRWILAFPTDPAAEIPKGIGYHGTVVADFPGTCFLDSLAMEADGKIAQACIVGKPGVARVDPASGAVIDHPSFGDRFTTNICFGGEDMRTAYVTLSETGRLIRLRWPAAGMRLPYVL